MAERKERLYENNKELFGQGNIDQYQRNCLRMSNLTREITILKRKVIA